jgi:hypothetical protein
MLHFLDRWSEEFLWSVHGDCPSIVRGRVFLPPVRREEGFTFGDLKNKNGIRAV